jgi:hypothetical protein
MVTVQDKVGIWYQIGPEEFVHSDYLVKGWNGVNKT